MTAMGSHQSDRAGTTTWLTPPAILDLFGGWQTFDLDPCAAVDQPWPTARTMFTELDDGLAQDWHQFGKTWMNPPYTNRVIGQWLGRLADHGDGIALIFARTETEVFHRHVWERCDALLFPEGRLHFHHISGDRAAANAGAPSVFCAYGPDSADMLAACGMPGAFVPLKLRAFALGFSAPGSWVDEVRKVMAQADRPMSVAQLYRCLMDSPKTGRNANWKAKIRQTLQRGPFAPLGDGFWELLGD